MIWLALLDVTNPRIAISLQCMKLLAEFNHVHQKLERKNKFASIKVPILQSHFLRVKRRYQTTLVEMERLCRCFGGPMRGETGGPKFTRGTCLSGQKGRRFPGRVIGVIDRGHAIRFGSLLNLCYFFVLVYRAKNKNTFKE